VASGVPRQEVSQLVKETTEVLDKEGIFFVVGKKGHCLENTGEGNRGYTKEGKLDEVFW
jgi:hypothetical protein